MTLLRNTVVRVGNGPTVEIRMQVSGPDGGCEFWFNCRDNEQRQYSEGAITSGGFECHWKEHSRPDYYKDREAHHADCKITGGACWHDGTSLWAREHWLPGMAHGGEEWVWRELEAEYLRQIAVKQEAAS